MDSVEIGGDARHQIGPAPYAGAALERCRRRTDDHDVLDGGPLVGANRRKLRDELCAHDDDACARVGEDVLVVGGSPQRIHRDRNGADSDGAEEAVEELGTVKEQQGDTLSDADTQPLAQSSTELVGARVELGVGDALVPALNGGLTAAALGEVAIDKVRRGVERRWDTEG